MPVLGCTKCHHEWEGRTNSKCDWCGGDSRVLAAQSDLEKLIASEWYVRFRTQLAQAKIEIDRFEDDGGRAPEEEK